MQSSSAARLACASVIAAAVLAYLPIPLMSDSLMQTVPLAVPVLTAVSNVEANAQTLPPQTNAPAATSTATTVKSVVKVAAATTATNSASPRLMIPSISLNDPIVNVGVDSTGAMAVPNGKTDQVGWYDGGPMPGQVGSAVLDAHVFAAFSKLDQVSVGDDIYVQENGQTLHFVVTAVKEFALSQITSQDLFTPTSDRDLNLITCAGKLTPDHSTYDHRLVVYSSLVN